jgi:DNA-directed RNA polymerase subunit RPC12/RpoP
MTHKVEWIDAKREPQCAPDPKYPNGMHVDLSFHAKKACLVNVTYPAPRCGHHVIVCSACGVKVVVTTAGRPDDPRTVKLRCKP